MSLLTLKPIQKMIILKSKPIDKTRINKIFIRGLNWRVGDTLMCFPFIQELKNIFPKAQIDLAVPSDMLYIYQSIQAIDNLIPIPRKKNISFYEKIKLWRKIKSNQYDLGISIQRAFEGALLLFMAGIPIRLGYASDHRRLLLTHSLSEQSWSMSMAQRHTAEYYLDLLRAFFDHNPPPPHRTKRLSPSISNSSYISLKEKLNPSSMVRLNSKDSKLDVADLDVWNYLVVSPGTSYGPAKLWIKERWGDLLTRIKTDYPHLAIVFIGAPFDKKAVKLITDKLEIEYIDLTGETSLGEFFALVKHANLVIATDNGVSHLRSAYAGPLISLFGSTNHLLTGPYYSPEAIMTKEVHCSPCLKAVCPLGTMECMQAIGTDEVYTKAKKLLSS